MTSRNTYSLSSILMWISKHQLKYQKLHSLCANNNLKDLCTKIVHQLGLYVNVQLSKNKSVNIPGLGQFIISNQKQGSGKLKIVFNLHSQLKLLIDYSVSDLKCEKTVGDSQITLIDYKEIGLMCFLDSNIVEVAISSICQSLVDLLGLGHNINLMIPNLIQISIRDKVMSYKVSEKLKDNKGCFKVSQNKMLDNFRRSQNIEKWNKSISSCMRGEISGTQLQWYLSKGRKLKVQVETIFNNN